MSSVLFGVRVAELSPSLLDYTHVSLFKGVSGHDATTRQSRIIGTRFRNFSPFMHGKTEGTYPADISLYGVSQNFTVALTLCGFLQ